MAKKIYVTSNHGYNGWLRDCKAMVDFRSGRVVLDLTQCMGVGICLDDIDTKEVMVRLTHFGIAAETIEV